MAFFALMAALIIAPIFTSEAPAEKRMEVFLFYSSQGNPDWQQQVQQFHALQEQHKSEAKFLAIDVGGFGGDWTRLVTQLTGVTVVEEADLLVAPLHIFVHRRVIGEKVAASMYLRSYEKADSTRLGALFVLLRETELILD